MPHPSALVANAIDNAPMNAGVRGYEWLADARNIPIVIGTDVALFEGSEGSVYEVHFLFTSRGKAAVASARESFRRMFIDHHAELIFGLVPDFRRDVKLLARWAGGKSKGLRATPDGPCELFVLSKQMWNRSWVS